MSRFYALLALLGASTATLGLAACALLYGIGWCLAAPGRLVMFAAKFFGASIDDGLGPLIDEMLERSYAEHRRGA